MENPTGLRLAVYHDPEARQTVARLVVPDRFQGYPGVVHGGVVAALLDEVAGRASLIEGGPDHLMVTATLDVRYRHPTPTGTSLEVRGWITHPGASRARARGEIRLADGSVTADAELVLVRPPPTVQEAWAAERPYWRVYPDEPPHPDHPVE